MSKEVVRATGGSLSWRATANSTRYSFPPTSSSSLKLILLLMLCFSSYFASSSSPCSSSSAYSSPSSCSDASALLLAGVSFLAATRASDSPPMWIGLRTLSDPSFFCLLHSPGLSAGKRAYARSPRSFPSFFSSPARHTYDIPLSLFFFFVFSSSSPLKHTYIPFYCSLRGFHVFQ